MIITEILKYQDSDPLWGLAVWCLLPLLMVEFVFLILAGTIFQRSAAKAGKGWSLGLVFFVLGIGLECGFAKLLRLLLPYENAFLSHWLLGIVFALVLVAVISCGIFHLFEWFDCSLYDRSKKNESLHRKSLGLYQRH